MSTERKAFGEKFRDGLNRIFSQLPLVPEDIIADVYSAEYAEDGKTFIPLLDLADGRTLEIQACPGKPLHIGVGRE